MGNNLDDLGDKGLVGGDFGVPVLDELPQDDGNEGVELKVHIVAAGQGWQQMLDGRWRGPALVGLLGTEDAADEEGRRLVRERGGGRCRADTTTAGQLQLRRLAIGCCGGLGLETRGARRLRWPRRSRGTRGRRRDSCSRTGGRHGGGGGGGGGQSWQRCRVVVMMDCRPLHSFRPQILSGPEQLLFWLLFPFVGFDLDQQRGATVRRVTRRRRRDRLSALHGFPVRNGRR